MFMRCFYVEKGALQTKMALLEIAQMRLVRENLCCMGARCGLGLGSNGLCEM